MRPSCDIKLAVADYDLEATLSSGQVFAWEQRGHHWVGVVDGNWVRLAATPGGIHAVAAEPQTDWTWLTHFLQTQVDLRALLATFPADDQPLQAATRCCRGLRLLRQDPWECLASFLLSSTKQIVQIQQIVRTLCARHGRTVMTPAGYAPAFAFPTAQQIAALSETDLRACKMGFRAKYLLSAARQIASGEFDLAGIRRLPLAAAREQMIQLSGVGEKIADCVLLFAYDFPAAFPVDVWVARALNQFYFRRRRRNVAQLRRFAARHFGLNAGYAQQYLFHYMRTQRPRPK